MLFAAVVASLVRSTVESGDSVVMAPLRIAASNVLISRVQINEARTGRRGVNREEVKQGCDGTPAGMEIQVRRSIPVGITQLAYIPKSTV